MRAIVRSVATRGALIASAVALALVTLPASPAVAKPSPRAHHAYSTTRHPVTHRAHPAKAHPAKPHPAKGHGAKAHPAKAHPAKPHPAKAHPAKAHPAKGHGAKARSVATRNVASPSTSTRGSATRPGAKGTHGRHLGAKRHQKVGGKPGVTKAGATTRPGVAKSAATKSASKPGATKSAAAKSAATPSTAATPVAAASPMTAAARLGITAATTTKAVLAHFDAGTRSTGRTTGASGTGSGAAGHRSAPILHAGGSSVLPSVRRAHREGAEAVQQAVANSISPLAPGATPTMMLTGILAAFALGVASVVLLGGRRNFRWLPRRSL